MTCITTPAPVTAVDNLETPNLDNLTINQLLDIFRLTRLATLTGTMDGEQKKLEDHMSNIEFFTKISEILTNLTDDKGGLDLTQAGGDELKEMLVKAKEMGAEIPADLRSFTPQQAQNLSRNIHSAIDRDKLQIDFGMNKSQKLQQQFHQIYLILNTVVKKLDETNHGMLRKIAS